MISAVCDQGCDKQFWFDTPEAWCATPFKPFDGTEEGACDTMDVATTVLDAFMITDSSAFPSFDPNTTLYDGLYPFAGMFAHMMRQGVAALLNASHPDVGFAVTPAEVKEVMQQAFSGEITERQAKQIFLMWNHCLGGCPLD